MRRFAALSCSAWVWWAGAIAAAQASPAPNADQPGQEAPAAPPPSAAAPDAAQTAPVVQPPAAVEAAPAPAAAPEAVAPVPAPPPSAASEPKAGGSPQPPAPNPYAYPRRWRRRTEADREQARRMLAEQRAQMRAARRRVQERAPGPRVYGDAGAALTIGLDITTMFLNDVGFKHFDGRGARPRFGVFASHDVATLARKLILAVELGAAIESADAPGLLGTNSQVSMDSQTFHAALDLRWDVLGFLAPQLRASGGVSLFQIELADRERSYLTQQAASGFGALGAGVLLHTPPRAFETHDGGMSSFGMGLLLEGGYALRSPIDVGLHAKAGTREIAVVDASLGRLSLSGAYFRTALLVRF